MSVILGPVTTKEESFRALMAAVELQAVLDYRDALYENTVKVDSGYITTPNTDILECERFFNDVGFVPYKMLREKVISFKKCVDGYATRDLEAVETFTCPICGGTVTVKSVKKNAVRFKPSQPRYVMAKQAKCDGCTFKVFI